MKANTKQSLKTPNGVYLSKCGRYMAIFKSDRQGCSLSFNKQLRFGRSNYMAIKKLKSMIYLGRF